MNFVVNFTRSRAYNIGHKDIYTLLPAWSAMKMTEVIFPKIHARLLTSIRFPRNRHPRGGFVGSSPDFVDHIIAHPGI